MMGSEGAQRSLTIDDLVVMRGESRSRVSARVAEWYAKQHETSLPRVQRLQAPGKRWSYEIDRATYEAWLLSNQDDPTEVPPFATPLARTLGCTCESFEFEGRRRAMVDEGCPVHGQWVKAS